MPDSLFSYIVSHSREPEGLKALREETQRLYPRCPTMAVGPDQGAFLGWLVEALGVEKAVEVAHKCMGWLRLYGADVHREAATLAELEDKTDE